MRKIQFFQREKSHSRESRERQLFCGTKSGRAWGTVATPTSRRAESSINTNTSHAKMTVWDCGSPPSVFNYLKRREV